MRVTLMGHASSQCFTCMSHFYRDMLLSHCFAYMLHCWDTRRVTVSHVARTYSSLSSPFQSNFSNVLSIARGDHVTAVAKSEDAMHLEQQAKEKGKLAIDTIFYENNHGELGRDSWTAIIIQAR